MKIGITGGIGSGKTYISQQLAAAGYPIYNCDDEAKRLMHSSPHIRHQLTSLIGSHAYTANGQLNRAAIAEYLFSNEEHAAHINAIVHPAVKADFRAWATRQTAPHCFMESAILFESGFNDTVDKVVLVYADEQTRLHRAIQRDHATEQQIRARMAQQIPTAEAVRRADYVLYNTQTANTAVEMQKLLNWIETNNHQ